MYRSKKKRNLIIFSLVGVLLCMAIGYAAFQTQLKVTGTSKVTSNWDIEITNVTEGTTTGSAENTVAPSWDKLWASMEANLYDKGDAMEYDVTIENKGTLDAKLNDILTNLENSNNEAVIITFSGYTKGEILKSKATKVIHVKIEYNPEYEGGETSSEVEINFDYTQNNNEENNPDSQYLLTYDYQTNGGQSVDLNQEYLVNGSNVDLSNTATKEGWSFVGWNTDKDAEVGLTSYQMPASNTTLYAIYSKILNVTYEQGENVTNIGKTNDSCNIYNNQTSCEITLPDITVNNGYVSNGWHRGDNKVGNANEKYSIKEDTTLTSKAVEDKIELSISTTSTTNSITVVANASATSGITKYEYSKDGGKTWTTSTSKTYTFNALTQTTSYNIMVRITSSSGKTISTSKAVTTSTITKPTFKETTASGKNTITITYPAGCGSSYTCTYQKDNGSSVIVTNTSTTVTFTANGSVVAKVSDGTNSVSSSYSTTIKYAITSSKNSTVNLTVTPNTTLSAPNKTITFTVPSSSTYSYQGAYVYNSSGTRVMTLSSSARSFTMPSYAVRIAPIFKYNDKYVFNYSSSVNDSTFTMNKYDTNATKPIFLLYNKTSSQGITNFYNIKSIKSDSDPYSAVDSRGQAVSSKTYNVSHYCTLSIVYGGSLWGGSGSRRLYLGLIRNNSTWLNSTSSPDYTTNVSLPISSISFEQRKTLSLSLNASTSGSNNYYVAFQYLSNGNASTLDVFQIYFTGCTYYS